MRGRKEDWKKENGKGIGWEDGLEEGRTEEEIREGEEEKWKRIFGRNINKRM